MPDSQFHQRQTHCWQGGKAQDVRLFSRQHGVRIGIGVRNVELRSKRGETRRVEITNGGEGKALRIGLDGLRMHHPAGTAADQDSGVSWHE